jgi:hypothetical protein
MVPHLKLASHATRQPSRKPSLQASLHNEVRQTCCAADVAAFKATGYDNHAVLDMLALAATKLISNYTNHLAETPNDRFMKGAEWTAPGKLKPAA